MTDEQLVEQMNEGNREAFRELYERYKKGVYNFALRFLLDKNAAEDVAHDVFLLMHDNIYQFDVSRGKFSTWLYSITYHECCRIRKRNKKFFLLGDNEEGIKNESNHNYNDAIDLERALLRVPEKYRLPIVMIKLHGLTSAECASVLGISETNVKQRVFRAFKMLKEYYKI
ncbi:MAG: RNA polymerase sigma factor [Bacteroidota bacterium]|nr:RNA polymerase sigma factor [Bacteroidota bacterium]